MDNGELRMGREWIIENGEWRMGEMENCEL
jgi:hypothetical protein